VIGVVKFVCVCWEVPVTARLAGERNRRVKEATLGMGRMR